MKSKATAGGCPGLGRGWRRLHFAAQVVTLDGLDYLSVAQMHFLGQHVLHSRLFVDTVVKRFVLDGRVARRIVLHGLALRYNGLHAIDDQPVYIKHQLQWDLT